MRVRVRYTGRVQGVGFRAAASEAARHLSIQGWVRNEPDGSVLLEAQSAEAGEIERLIAGLEAARGRFIIGRDRQDLADDPALAGTGFRVTR